MQRNKRKSSAKKSSGPTSLSKRAGMKGSQREKTLQRRKWVQRKRLSSSDKEYTNNKLLYNDGYNTGFAKGFEYGHLIAYEQKLQ